jgi:hypothetical protein
VPSKYDVNNAALDAEVEEEEDPPELAVPVITFILNMIEEDAP